MGTTDLVFVGGYWYLDYRESSLAGIFLDKRDLELFKRSIYTKKRRQKLFHRRFSIS
jgi:hypothetical protein